MKKLLILAILFGIFIQLNPTIKADTQKKTFYLTAMYTDVSVTLYDGVDPIDEIAITEIIRKYDFLANNFVGPVLDHENELYRKNNVFTINENRGIQAVTVDDELFVLIKEALLLSKEMNGYFNPAMGEVIDIWKSVILGPYMYLEIPETLYNETMAEIAELSDDIDPNEIVLDEEHKTVFITNPDLKLDLGAYAKGYVANLVETYVKSKGIEHYIINIGSSTLSIGTHPDDGQTDRPISVRILDPLNLYEAGTAGIVYLRNKSVSSSGNNIQFALYKGKRYHHIISPFEFIPKDYYHTLTLIGDDAGLLDALSTAVFNIPLVDAKLLLDKYDVSGVFYMNDGHIETYNLKDNKFVIGTVKKDESQKDLSALYLILGGVVIIGGATLIILNIKDSKKKQEVGEADEQ